MRHFLSKLHPFDILVYSYVIVIIFILAIFGDITGIAGYHILILIGYLILVTATINYLNHYTKGWQSFVRRAYPLLTILFLYEQSGLFINIIFPEFFDYQIIIFERSILGFNPTIALQTLYNPILNEILYLCYYSYFFFIPVISLYLYFNRRYFEFEKLITVSCLAFYISYITFILYPVEGPRYALAEMYWMKPAGYLFVPLVNQVINFGGLHGGCMPSSHIAVAITSTLIAYKYARTLFPFYLTFTIGLMIGTVWGRFHYVSDGIAGIIVAIISYIISEKITNRHNQR
ncbi:MAG: phosphatase PAP2 family protein [candidate division Zixibacteria bacterium]|nr:phosphatase PAP2 family protein [candidate division Zixibacteria bacterium]